MRFRTSLIAGSAAVLSAGLALGGMPAANAAMHASPAVAPPVVGVPPPPASEQRKPGPPGNGLTQVKYDNWAGYADSGSNEKYTKVSSSWTQPALTCPSSGSGYQIAVFWVGIDGFSNNTVEQGGSEGYCYGGKAYYATWWEHWPVNDIQYVGKTVKPGDKITASVVRSGTKYTVKVTDSTTPANSFTHSFSCSASSCQDTSAEWIAEAPNMGTGNPNQLYPLADFHKWSDSNSAVANATTAGNIKSFPDDEITMVGTNDTKASPSALNSAGTAFSVTWKHST